jgi:hypothetical protein
VRAERDRERDRERRANFLMELIHRVLSFLTLLTGVGSPTLLSLTIHHNQFKTYVALTDFEIFHLKFMVQYFFFYNDASFSG